MHWYVIHYIMFFEKFKYMFLKIYDTDFNIMITFFFCFISKTQCALKYAITKKLLRFSCIHPVEANYQYFTDSLVSKYNFYDMQQTVLYMWLCCKNIHKEIKM